eukprot:GDKI01044734.1.p1 GENE.GDKI01044734.1~~GDKI01044734.1.p1  ORF type:complete len:186 (+),score=25.70 GDKI01044734.1:655-1212(+)
MGTVITYCVLRSLDLAVTQREMRTSFLLSVELGRQLQTISRQQMQLEKMAATQKHFFYKATHELRTPLNSILYCADAARQELTTILAALAPPTSALTTYPNNATDTGSVGMLAVRPLAVRPVSRDGSQLILKCSHPPPTTPQQSNPAVGARQSPHGGVSSCPHHLLKCLTRPTLGSRTVCHTRCH